jgi:hypothetical protein
MHVTPVLNNLMRILSWLSFDGVLCYSKTKYELNFKNWPKQLEKDICKTVRLLDWVWVKDLGTICTSSLHRYPLPVHNRLPLKFQTPNPDCFFNIYFKYQDLVATVNRLYDHTHFSHILVCVTQKFLVTICFGKKHHSFESLSHLLVAQNICTWANEKKTISCAIAIENMNEWICRNII